MSLKQTQHALALSSIHLRRKKIACGQNTSGHAWHSTVPLGVGANGGHGPIRYFVEAYTPGESITFRFTGPKGFDGFHGFELVSGPNQRVVLRHTLSMTTHGPAVVSWPLVFRPMHDALIEDSLATAQESLGGDSHHPTMVALGENPTLGGFGW